ncbi:DUF2071 domain-containing protein [Halobacillus fulvus]|nr:DUF2071 domain-containing protein [Halobacillus fulvus]
MDSKQWIMRQTWENLVFMHWPVDEEALRPFIPDSFTIDVINGQAWIAIVPFRMNHIRFRGLPEIAAGNQLLELNVRTYVTYKGEPGVYFITLDANHPLGVFLARTVFGLPYVNAEMKLKQKTNHLQFTSRRTHKGYDKSHFHASVDITSPIITPSPDSLTSWLTERYALWVQRGRTIYKGPIQHKNWSLQEAKARIDFNQLTDFLPPGSLSGEPLTHYSKTLDTYIYPFERKGKYLDF